MPKAILVDHDGTHKYRIEGDDRVSPDALLPSVSNIAKHAEAGDSDGLIWWGINAFAETGNKADFARRRELAGIRGTNIHAYISQMIKSSLYGPVREMAPAVIRDDQPIPEWDIKMLDKWRSEASDHVKDWVATEVSVYNPELGYAGTYDALALDQDDDVVIFDWKTRSSYGPPRNTDAVQLGGYALAMESMNSPLLPMPLPTIGKVVYLYHGLSQRKDGTSTSRPRITWCWVNLDLAKEAFRNCVALYKLATKGCYYEQ